MTSEPETTPTKFASAYDVIVVGAGAAGLYAAGTAASRGKRTLLLEKNRKLGVKILMSGGTRCNLTHDVDWRGIAEAFPKTQSRFLKFALASLTPDLVVDFFQSFDVPTKVESTGKVFPQSDKAIDVRDALVKFAMSNGAEIQSEVSVKEVVPAKNGFVIETDTANYFCRSAIVTVGGQSYPGCGTTGDGYSMMAKLGHTIIEPRPALVPIRISSPWVHDLKGVTIDDVGVQVTSREGKKLNGSTINNRGSFLFTHFGVSGPIAMNVSRIVTAPEHAIPKSLSCDWVPGLHRQKLVEEIEQARRTTGQRTLINWLSQLLPAGTSLPRRLFESLLQQQGVDSNTRMAELSRNNASRVAEQLKSTSLPVDGTLGFKKAEVTAGGVALQEVNPKTMESKLVPGLFIAGELLDVDGPIGGYNFQAAFSTGNLAGMNA